MSTVREVTYEILRDLGMTKIFGNPGSSELPFLKDLPPGFDYVLGLQALGALLDFEFDGLAFVEGFIALGLDRRKVDENILPGLALDESVSLAGVEPLHCSLFFHFYNLALSYLRVSY